MDIREASPADFSRLVSLTASEGWNYKQEDFRLLCNERFVTTLVAAIDGEIRGMITLFDYENVGWISNMLVERAYRGRDLGTKLLREGVNRLGSKPTVALFSYENTTKFYIREGFRLEGIYSVVSLSKGNRRTISDWKMGIDEIASMDQQAFHMSRRGLLEMLARERKIVSPLGVNGFAIVRPDPLEPVVGPVVCDDPLEGRELLISALGILGMGAKAVMVGGPFEGFQVEQKVCRLYFGERPQIDRDKAVAFAGLEFG